MLLWELRCWKCLAPGFTGGRAIVLWLCTTFSPHSTFIFLDTGLSIIITCPIYIPALLWNESYMRLEFEHSMICQYIMDQMYRQIIDILIKSHCNESWHFPAEIAHVVLLLFPIEYTVAAKGHPGEVGLSLAYFVPYVTVHIKPPQVLHSKYLWSWASCFTNPNGKYFKAA